MTDFKARWSALIDEYCDASEEYISAPVQSPTPLATVTETEQEISAEVATEELATCEIPTATADDLPIYEATAAQINYWHANGAHIFLQGWLREYDLDFASANVAAYNHLKIGMDFNRHVATFAIDETHYYLIQFDKDKVQPLDETEAQRVLEKICAIREAKSYFKEYCGFQLEYFD